MVPERDEYSGRYTREYTREDFVTAVAELGSASTREVAKRVGCSTDLAYRRLVELSESGRVKNEKISGTYRWFVQNECGKE